VLRQSGFECFPARQRVKEVELALLVKIAGQDQFPGLAQLGHPGGVGWPELLFELLPDFLRQGGTVPRGRNGDLQIAASNNRRIEEVAETRKIDYVPEDAQHLSLVIDAFIQSARSCSHDNEKRPVQVVVGEGAEFEF